MRRTPLRRRPMVHRPRQDRPAVDWPAIRREVIERDGVCFLYHLDPSHVCQDGWGTVHFPDDAAKLTLDHVKPEPRMARKGPDDPRWLVAMCYAGNVRVPSKAVRLAERIYLAAMADWTPHEACVDPCSPTCRMGAA